MIVDSRPRRLRASSRVRWPAAKTPGSVSTGILVTFGFGIGCAAAPPPPPNMPTIFIVLFLHQHIQGLPWVDVAAQQIALWPEISQSYPKSWHPPCPETSVLSNLKL